MNEQAGQPALQPLEMILPGPLRPLPAPLRGNAGAAHSRAVARKTTFLAVVEAGDQRLAAIGYAVALTIRLAGIGRVMTAACIVE